MKCEHIQMQLVFICIAMEMAVINVYAVYMGRRVQCIASGSSVKECFSSICIYPRHTLIKVVFVDFNMVAVAVMVMGFVDCIQR